MLEFKTVEFGTWLADGIIGYETIQRYAKKLWGSKESLKFDSDIYFCTTKHGVYSLVEIDEKNHRIIFSAAGPAYVPEEKMVVEVLKYYYYQNEPKNPEVLIADVKNGVVVFDCINKQDTVFFSGRPFWVPERNCDMLAYYINPQGEKIPIRLNGDPEATVVSVGCKNLSAVLCRTENPTSDGIRFLLDLYAAVGNYPSPSGVNVVNEFKVNAQGIRTGQEKLDQLKTVCKKNSATVTTFFAQNSINLTDLIDGKGKNLTASCNVDLDIPIDLGRYSKRLAIYNPAKDTVFLQLYQEVSIEEAFAIESTLEQATGLVFRIADNLNNL